MFSFFFLLAIDFSCGGEASLLMMVSLNGQIPPLMRGLSIISLFWGVRSIHTVYYWPSGFISLIGGCDMEKPKQKRQLQILLHTLVTVHKHEGY